MKYDTFDIDFKDWAIYLSRILHKNWEGFVKVSSSCLESLKKIKKKLKESNWDNYNKS